MLDADDSSRFAHPRRLLSVARQLLRKRKSSDLRFYRNSFHPDISIDTGIISTGFETFTWR